MENEIIVCEQLAYSYTDEPVLKGLSFFVHPGEIFALLGHNGAGKTTTIRILSGLLHGFSGSASVFGLRPQRDGARIRKKVGVLTETPALYGRLTAWQNLRFFGTMMDISSQELQRQAQNYLDMFDLVRVADQRVETYSKGMMQRLAVVRALLSQPQLLFLDEPYAGLDPESAKLVRELIVHISRVEGGTIVICSHRLAEMEGLFDRAAIIFQGCMTSCGSLNELRADAMAGNHVSIQVQGLQKEVVFAASDTIAGVSGVRNEAHGSFLFQIDDTETIAPIVSYLAQKGGRIYAVEPRIPSLEEVYLSLQKEVLK